MQGTMTAISYTCDIGI